MEYIRQNLEFVPAGTLCRAHGMLRAEIRDRALKIRIQLEGMTPAPYGTYSAEMICVKEGRYRRFPLGGIRTDQRGRGELLYRRNLDDKGDGPGPQDFQVFRVLKGKEGPTELLSARIENAANWQELPEWNPSSYEKKIPDPAPPAAEKIQLETAPTEIVMPPQPIATAVSPPLEPEASVEQSETAQEEQAESEPVRASAEPLAEQYLFEHMPPIQPFYHSDQQWIRVDPPDLSGLPIHLTEVETSPFIMNGYTRYKHLIVSRERDGYQLGVPYRYVPDMAQEASKDGFYEFRAAHSQVPKNGDFGYWIEKIPYNI